MKITSLSLYCFLLSVAASFQHADAFSMSSMSAANPNTFGTNDALEDCISRVEKQHAFEFQVGEEAFGSSVNDDVNKFSDNDFTAHSVGEGNGGPSEFILNNGHLIFESEQAVINEKQCEFLIKAARETIEKERDLEQKQQSTPGEDFRRTTNSALGEARLSKLPSEALDELRLLLQEKLYPMLINRFGTEDLTVYDGLILSNVAPSMSQPVHRDASLLTCNIALSSPDDFVGGGTFIETLQSNNGLPLKIEKGKLLCHSSGIMHAGTAITEGERWVMVLFIIAKNEPQIPRRTHAEGLELIDCQSLGEAKVAFEAGLSVAPKDHILHMGLGQIASMRGEDNESLDRLLKASTLYPGSHKAAMTAGKILESKRQPRAALRRFEQVLSHINDKDLIDGAWMPLKSLAWDARVCAGRCALLCAEVEAGQSKWAVHERTWTKKHLPAAIERLRIALMFAPEDDYMQSMFERAEELLMEANAFPGN